MFQQWKSTYIDHINTTRMPHLNKELFIMVSEGNIMHCRTLRTPAPYQLKVLVVERMPKNTICAIRGVASLWSSITKTSIGCRTGPEVLKTVKICQSNSSHWASKSKCTKILPTASCQMYSWKVRKVQRCHHPLDVLMPLSPFSSLTLILVLILCYQQCKVYRNSLLGNLGIGSFRFWHPCYQQCPILHTLRYRYWCYEQGPVLHRLRYWYLSY